MRRRFFCCFLFFVFSLHQHEYLKSGPDVAISHLVKFNCHISLSCGRLMCFCYLNLQWQVFFLPFITHFWRSVDQSNEFSILINGPEHRGLSLTTRSYFDKQENNFTHLQGKPNFNFLFYFSFSLVTTGYFVT